MSIIFAFIFILGITFVTRSVILSLGVGLLLTSLLATNFNPLAALSLVGSKLWNQLDLVAFINVESVLSTWSLFVFLFIFLLGFIIELMQRGGFFIALQDTIAKYVKKAIHVEILSLSLSKIFVLDDYLSCLAVGSIMSKSFDKFKLTRTKLAFLIDSMSAPLALLCPISSWSVIIVGIFKSQAFINSHFTEYFAGNPLTQFFYILPYLFYSFIICCACWYIVLKRISFGKIDSPEFLRKEEQSQQSSDVKFIHFLVPFLSLIVGVITLNLVLGGYTMFGGKHGILEAFQSSNSAAALCFASLISACLTLAWMLYKRIIHLKEIPKLAWNGFKGVYIAILILWLSWSMSSILTQNLNIGVMIAELLSNDLPVSLFPVIFFALALLTGFVTGTSWGTVAIVAPIVISIFDSLYVASGMTIDPNLLMVCLGATISGGICGDHLSPLCSTTVMAAISTDISPILHARTQIYYTIPIALSTIGAFYFSAKLVSYGIFISSILCGLCAIFLCCAILNICSRVSAKNRAQGVGYEGTLDLSNVKAE